jgi:hypothetical protein
MIDQLAIACTGAIAVWLSQDARDTRRRWACWFGLAGQPFWLYTTWHAQQWGIFALAFVYTYAWWRGFRHHWLAKGARHA